MLIGLVGGVTMTAITGWRRTESAMDRFLDFHRPYNAYVEGELDRDKVMAIDGVVATQDGDYFLLAPVVDGKARPDLLGAVSPFSHDDTDTLITAARPILVAGRLADPEREREVVVDEEAAELLDLVAGSVFEMQAYTFEQGEDLFVDIGGVAPAGDILSFTATGVIRSPQDVQGHRSVPDVVYLGSGEMHLGPAFHAAHVGQDVASLGVLFGDLLGPGVDQYELRVDLEATDRDAFEAAIRRLDPEAAIALGASDAQQAAEDAQRSIELEASLLLGLGLVVLVGGTVLVGQALRRQLEEDAVTQQAMRVLGMDRGTILRGGLVKGAAVAAAAAVTAVLVAVALSPLTPVGDARRAEVTLGVHADWTVLLGGAGVLLAAIVARVVAPAWRPAPRRSERARDRGVGLSERAARAGLPPSIVAGVRAAGLATGASAVAATAFVAAVGIVGGFGYASSEARLATDPVMWGWTFDAVVGDGNDPELADRAAASLEDHPVVDAYALVNDLDAVAIRANGRVVDVGGSAVANVQGHIRPRMLAGQAPSTDDEIALGGATARQLGVDVGDEVEVELGEGPTSFRVSGLAVLNMGFDSERIGEGSILTPDGVERAGGELEPTFALVEYAPGVDPTVAYDELRDDWGNTVLRPIPTTDIDQLHSVRLLPIAFSLVLAALSVLTLAFVLMLTIRRRRHDLALLRTLGFDGRQLRATLAAQATTLLLPAVVAGAVGGVVVGRLSWTLTVASLGAPQVHVTPTVAGFAVALGALVLGNLMAAIPGRTAARTRPAAVLRSE